MTTIGIESNAALATPVADDSVDRGERINNLLRDNPPVAADEGDAES
jgi:hypothetical protein